MSLQNKQALMKRVIEANPVVLGSNKYKAIYAYIYEHSNNVIGEELIAEVISLDRVWRKVLEDNPHLDHRGDTSEKEKQVKADLGYNI